MDFLYTDRLPREEAFCEITVRDELHGDDELNGDEVFEESCLGYFVCTYEYERTFHCPGGGVGTGFGSSIFRSSRSASLADESRVSIWESRSLFR